MRKNISSPKLINHDSELYNLPYHKENKINKLLSTITKILLCMIIITVCICIIFVLYIYYFIKKI
jgi:hypothetical protein